MEWDQNMIFVSSFPGTGFDSLFLSLSPMGIRIQPSSTMLIALTLLVHDIKLQKKSEKKMHLQPYSPFESMKLMSYYIQECFQSVFYSFSITRYSGQWAI